MLNFEKNLHYIIKYIIFVIPKGINVSIKFYTNTNINNKFLTNK